MSFFSCSWYSNVNSPVSNFDLAVKAMRDRLNRYRQFANLDIEIGEFAVLSDERGRRLYAGDASEWSASFFAAIADRVYRYNVAQVYQWDEATSGILQPRGEVIQMLERMAGGRRRRRSRRPVGRRLRSHRLPQGRQPVRAPLQSPPMAAAAGRRERSPGRERRPDEVRRRLAALRMVDRPNARGLGL